MKAIDFEGLNSKKRVDTVAMRLRHIRSQACFLNTIYPSDEGTLDLNLKT
jgi:hypothetical protein